MRVALLITLIGTVCFSSLAQTDSAQEQTVNYLKINGTQAQYEEAFDQMINLIKSQFETKGVPEAHWSELARRRDEKVAGILNMLASVYRSYFDEADIQNLYDHYSSAPEVQKANISAFMDSPTGQKLGVVQQGLIQNISAASESWSRDLYMATLEELKEMGFTPKQQ